MIDIHSGEVVETGYQHSPEISRNAAASPIPRSAFLDEAFSHVSGLLWSRASIGTLGYERAPLSLIHNPMATVPMPRMWGVWDKEFVTNLDGSSWECSDVLAHPE
jgi:hypothetical protein